MITDKKPVSRGRFLAQSAVAAGAALTAGRVLDPALLTPAEAARNQATTELVVMYNADPSNLPPAQKALFEKLNPDIKIRQLLNDGARYNAMLAAGNPPDVLEAGASNVSAMAAAGLVTNLTPYLAKSKAIHAGDLLSANDAYRWDGKAVGKGPYYGLAKDWSPDATVWYNKKLFDAAGVKYLSATEPTTYDELLSIAKKLTVRKNGAVQVYGLDPSWSFDHFLLHMIHMMNTLGASFFSPDGTTADFTTPQALRVVTWMVDWGKARVGAGPLDQNALGPLDLFAANRLAILLAGYWVHGALFNSAPQVLAHSAYAPAPLFGSKRTDESFFAQGAVIPAQAKNKEAAWRFMEFFIAGTPSQIRSRQGNGLPSVKEYLPLVPHSTAADQASYATLRGELPHVTSLKYTPYADMFAMGTAVQAPLTAMIQGQMSLTDGTRRMTTLANGLLRKGKALIG